MGMKIHVLYLGKMEFPRFRLVECQNEETMVVSPAVAILIQHPTLGNILYDTGNSEDFLQVYTKEMLHDYPHHGEHHHCGGPWPRWASPRRTSTRSSSPTLHSSTTPGA